MDKLVGLGKGQGVGVMYCPQLSANKHKPTFIGTALINKNY
jgi:hypothetical protein